MRWIKKGLIFSVNEKNFGNRTHAQVPTVLVLKDRLRIYFSTRPKPDISITSYVDIDKNDFTKILYVHDGPILELGSPGTFDEFGIMPACVIKKDDLVFLYYSGWQRGITIPYSNFTGLAVSEDNGKTFKRYAKGPVLDRTPFEIYSATSPHVLYENNLWHMFYCSGTFWHLVNGKYEHTYDIKYAFSENGTDWHPSNKIIIPQLNPFEAITRPTILKINDYYHMWYCFRGSEDFRNGKDSYSIGYAFSKDLLNWKRKDENSGITLSSEGWDSNMQAYPEVKVINGKIFMFYNGNSFGKEGFGYAILEDN